LNFFAISLAIERENPYATTAMIRLSRISSENKFSTGNDGSGNL
jgi:hypothetical protein